MGVALTTTIEETPEATRINLEGEDGGVLIRRGGEGLQALQHLVATAFRKQLGDDNRIVIDCNGFRRDKDAELRQMALFMAEKARSSARRRRWGRSIRTNAASSTLRLPRTRGHVGEHRRRVHEDGDHLGQGLGTCSAASVMFATDDTIVAIATPPGRGGIGVVRISGRRASRFAARSSWSRPLRPRRATFTRRAGRSATLAREAADDSHRHLLSGPAFLHRRGRRRDQRARQSRRARTIVCGGDRAGARLARAGRVHAARVS